MNFAPKTIIGEVRIRSVRIFFDLGLTCFMRYWFPKESISPLAKPFITLLLDSYFVRTQSTETSPTYVATSSITCSYFAFPLICHQIWCFSIPSCYGKEWTKYNRFLYLSGSCFSLFLFLTPPRVVPNVWHFPDFVGATSTNSLMIKLQPKIYDHIMVTVRISFIPSVCSQIPVIVIHLLEPRGLSVETFTNNRHFYGFSITHSCSFHTFGYMVPNRRSFPYFFDNRVGYLYGIDCTSSLRGLDEYNER